MDDQSPLLSLSMRVSQLEGSADVLSGRVAEFGARVEQLSHELDVEQRLERNNRNWLVVFCTGALAFAGYVTFVNTPVSLRTGGAPSGLEAPNGLPATLAEPAIDGSAVPKKEDGAPARTAAGVGVIDPTRAPARVRVVFQRSFAEVPVVVVTPVLGAGEGDAAVVLVEVSEAGFTAELRPVGDAPLPSAPVRVHWMARARPPG